MKEIKNLKKNEADWWFDINDTLSYNCLLNFVVGDRGGGKSFNTLRFLIKRFLKHGEQFIYLRRTMEEIKDSAPTIFDDIKKEGYFADVDLESSKKVFKCNDEVMGLPRALSTSMNRRSISLPKVKWILFDEFMVDGKTSRYIGTGNDEVFLFRNFYETVGRMKDMFGEEVRVIFLANAFSTVNIYFQEFGVKLPQAPPYKQFNKFDDVLVTIWDGSKYREVKEKSRWYKLNEGTQFNEYAYANDFYLDTTEFIRKVPKSAEFAFGLEYQQTLYTVWVDYNKGKYYCSSKGGDTNPNNTFSMSMEDNSPNNINIRRVKNLPFFKHFRLSVDENNVYYDSLKIYHALQEVIYLMRTTK